MQTTSSRENAGASLYVQALHEFAALIGLEPSEILETGSVEAEGVRFYFQDHADHEDKALCVLAEIGEIPVGDNAEVLRQLLEANSHLAPQAGTYALIPGTSRAALRVHVQLDEAAANGERILAVLKDHLATCTAVRHLGQDLALEQETSLVDSKLA